MTQLITPTPQSKNDVSRPADLRGETLNRILPMLAFPKISIEEFNGLPDLVKKDLLSRNRIVSTDTYNRTMEHLAEKEKRPLADKAGAIGEPTLVAFDQATYTLQMRRAPHGFLISCGIEDLVEELTLIKISVEEFEFAKAYYKQTAVPFFNEELWKWVVEQNGGALPIEVRGLRDGHVVAPGDPVLCISGPSELIAHFEHKVHRVFYPMLVAAQAKVLADIVGDPKRFIEVGLRGAVTDEQHLIALKAVAVGGGFMMTSNDAGKGAYDMRDVGTIGHRYIQRFESEEGAYKFAVENLPQVTLLIDLIDSYKGIELALKVKGQYRDTQKPIFVRLDSGDLLDQSRFYFRKAFALGFNDPARDKLIVEGMDSIEEVREIEQTLVTEFGEGIKKFVVYGAGGLLISDKVSRSDASSGFKLSAFTESNTGRLLPSMKFSNSPGKQSLPGAPELSMVGEKRMVTQRGEGPGVSLFETLYANGHRASKSSLEEAHARVTHEYASLSFTQKDGKRIAVRGMNSPQTEYFSREVRRRYGLA